LLLADSTTLVNLSRTFGVKASFTRDPETQALMLSLRGAKASVQQAKEEITTLPEVGIHLGLIHSCGLLKTDVLDSGSAAEPAAGV